MTHPNHFSALPEYLPTISEFDQKLFASGKHRHLWKILGAREFTSQTNGLTTDENTGTAFTVWAPAARKVSVFGDFNNWNPSQYPLHYIGDGLWDCFIPQLNSPTNYKFRVTGADSIIRDKADPMANHTQVPPATASVSYRSKFHWTDEVWLAQRTLSHSHPTNPSLTDTHTAPLSIYEVHLGSWQKDLDYQQLAHALVDYVGYLGFTHVELLPITEHPYGKSWGYQTTSLFAPTSRFGSPDDFRYFVNLLHHNNIGVILDWVPAHFPKDPWALSTFDGTALYEYDDPQRAEQNDWGTLVYDYSNPIVRSFLISSALYWCNEFHIDGLRVDAVSSMLYLNYSRREWTPNKFGGNEHLEAITFLQELNETLHTSFPGVLTIAEESTPWPGVTRPQNLGGLGFSYKWNMGWMNNTLAYHQRDHAFRQFHHHELIAPFNYWNAENFMLPFSHDEVVHGKGTLWSRAPGTSVEKAAATRCLLAYQWATPGKKLLFMGQEFGQTTEWHEGDSLPWQQLAGWEGELHRGIVTLVGDLNREYRNREALHSGDCFPQGFSWIDSNDTQGHVISFIRNSIGDNSLVVAVFNFSETNYQNYQIGLPQAGRWIEIMNTDSTFYAGTGRGNCGAVNATNHPWHGRKASVQLVLPANSSIWLIPSPHDGKNNSAR